MRNNKKLIVALTGAVLFGLVAVALVTRYLANAQAYTKSLNNVVIAKQSIPVGTKITAEMLDATAIPNGSMPDGAFKDVAKVVGRVAIIPIGMREPLTDTKLAPEGAAGGLPAVIPEGYRAMTVKVDDVVGLSGFALPGSFVDVVCVITPADQQGGANPISKIILQNIKVLASGSKIDQPQNEREPSPGVKAVTLQVTPEQAERLALATNEGKLQLVMRNYGDQADTQTRGVNKASLLSGESYVPPPAAPKVEAPKAAAQPAPMRRQPIRYVEPREEKRPAPAPAAPVAPRDSVEMIEGAKKKNVEFP
jgi:pilus assembly protein CpaB